MNYRQWKKKYKKLHRENPPLRLDKRKQRRLLEKTVKAISSVDFADAATRAAEAITNALACIMRFAAGGFDSAGTVCRNVADNIQPLEYESIFSLEVRELSKSGYAVYEKNALSGSETLRTATYSKKAAEKIVEILQNDELEYVKRMHPEWIKRRTDTADSLRAAVITAYESGGFNT